MIRDEEGFSRHVDYIHWNPVKHGWVDQVSTWPYSEWHLLKLLWMPLLLDFGPQFTPRFRKLCI
jgi:hypothetical protein